MKRIIIVMLVGGVIGFVFSKLFGLWGIIPMIIISGLWGWNADKIFDKFKV
jgi:uncharacterized membrane protein YeaQ/YmgE (transglycosylase-associated protein family)